MRLRGRPAIYLWLAAGLFIVYGTSLPFRFVADPAFAREKLAHVPLAVFAVTDARRGLSLPDMVQNILLFVPFGIFGVRTLGRRWHALQSIAIVTGLGFALSVFVEALQLFTIDRSSSLNDVVMNTTGALIGAIVAPLAARSLRETVELFRAYGLGATARSLYPLVVATALLCVAAWHPFDVALNLGGMWSDVKRLLVDPMQAGAFRDQPADALRYALFAVAAVRWLRDVGSGRPALLAGCVTMMAACLLEGSQVFLQSRAPGLEDVLVGMAGGWAGAAAAVSPIRRWAPMRIAAVVIVLAWVAAAIFLLTPFEWMEVRRPFHWLPFEGYYRQSSATTVSNVIEIIMAFFPVGFVLARARRGSIAWPLVAALTVAMMWPLEFLQGWTRDRVPDVTGIGIAVLGSLLGTWMAGPVREQFCRDLSSKKDSRPRSAA